MKEAEQEEEAQTDRCSRNNGNLDRDSGKTHISPRCTWEAIMIDTSDRPNTRGMGEGGKKDS